MARGRFYWGIGVRSLPTDLHLYGVKYQSMDDVRERGKEALEVILGLWEAKDGHFGFDGKYYQVHAPEIDPTLGRRLYYQPYQKPHPPIGVAASTPTSDTLRMAGERGWIPMTNLMGQHVRNLWKVVEEGAASTGREADRRQLRLGREVYVGETPKSARAEARIVLGRPFEEHQYVNRKAQGTLRYVKRDPAMPDEAVDVDYMMEHVWIVGDPQECADKIRQLHEEVGGFGHLLAITQDPDDHELMQRSLRILMEEVAPRVSDLE
jgi:alkanesulfonate monooxygenase SsuD/methylene tetrahydromethanopterin reductase-like flavin-dependent oxidoreductase (luciferase family)